MRLSASISTLQTTRVLQASKGCRRLSRLTVAASTRVREHSSGTCSSSGGSLSTMCAARSSISGRSRRRVTRGVRPGSRGRGMHHSMPWCTRHCLHALGLDRTRWSSSLARPHSMVRPLPNGQDAIHHHPCFITLKSYFVMAATLCTVHDLTSEGSHGPDCDCCIFMSHSYNVSEISFSVNFGSRFAQGDGRAIGARSTAKPFLSAVSGGGRGAGSGGRHAESKSYQAKRGSSGGPSATRSTPEWPVGLSFAMTKPTINRFMNQQAQTGACVAIAMPTSGSCSSPRLLLEPCSVPSDPIPKPEQANSNQQHRKVQLCGTQQEVSLGHRSGNT